MSYGNQPGEADQRQSIICDSNNPCAKLGEISPIDLSSSLGDLLVVSDHS